jgi:hypothetical protein
MKELVDNFTASRQKLDEQLEQFIEKNNDLELKYNLLKSEYDKDTEHLRQQLETIDFQR